MHKLANIVMALLLGFLIASASGARNAARAEVLPLDVDNSLRSITLEGIHEFFRQKRAEQDRSRRSRRSGEFLTYAYGDAFTSTKDPDLFIQLQIVRDPHPWAYGGGAD